MYEVSDRLNRKLTNRLKRFIRQMLYDTGEMYRSTQVHAKVDTQGTIYIYVYSVEYLVYHWEDVYGVYVGSNLWSNLIGEIYTEWGQYMVKRNPLLSGFMEVLTNVRAYVHFELVNQPN